MSERLGTLDSPSVRERRKRRNYAAKEKAFKRMARSFQRNDPTSLQGNPLKKTRVLKIDMRTEPQDV